MEAWFANPNLLWFAAAALLPWLLRFLMRPRYRNHPWAATRLMAAARSRVQAQVSWLQWLLLLTQTIALLLLATALANPHGGPQGLSVKGTPAHRVWWILVLDDSYSMLYESDKQSHMKQAVDQATDIVEQAAGKDAFSLLSMSRSQPWIVSTPSYDHAAIVESLAEWEAMPRRSDLRRTLAALEDQIKLVNADGDFYEQIRVVFWSDMSAVTWRDLDTSAVKRQVSQLQNVAFARVQDMADFGPNNLTLRGLQGIPSLVPDGASFPFWVEIVNQDATSALTGSIRFSVDGRFQFERSIRLDPLEERQFKLVGEVTGVGQHWLDVELNDDPLAIDHHRWAVVEVPDQLHVVCWTDRPSEQTYLASALNSMQNEGRRIEVEFGGPDRLTGKRPRQAVLVIGAVKSVTDAQQDQVRNFLDSGGGLIAFAGPSSRPWRVMGALSEEFAEAAAWKATTASELRMELVEPLPPLTRIFQGAGRDTLLQTPLWRQWVAPKSAQPSLTTLIETDEGGPLLAAMSHEKGRVLVWLSALDPADIDGQDGQPWSALAVWPSYPPLLSRMLDWAAGGTAPFNLTIPFSTAAAGTKVLDQEVWTLQSDAPSASRSGPGATIWPGVYSRSLGQGQTALRAVNVDSRESASERFDVLQLPAWFRSLDNLTPTSAQTMDSGQRSRWYQWCLFVVGGLLMFEVWITGRLQGQGRGRRSNPRAKESS